MLCSESGVDLDLPFAFKLSLNCAGVLFFCLKGFKISFLEGNHSLKAADSDPTIRHRVGRSGETRRREAPILTPPTEARGAVLKWRRQFLVVSIKPFQVPLEECLQRTHRLPKMRFCCRPRFDSRHWHWAVPALFFLSPDVIVEEHPQTGM